MSDKMLTFAYHLTKTPTDMKTVNLYVSVSCKVDNYSIDRVKNDFQTGKSRFGLDRTFNSLVTLHNVKHISDVVVTELGNVHHNNQLTPTCYASQTLSVEVKYDDKPTNWIDHIQPDVTSFGLDSICPWDIVIESIEEMELTIEEKYLAFLDKHPNILNNILTSQEKHNVPPIVLLTTAFEAYCAGYGVSVDNIEETAKAIYKTLMTKNYDNKIKYFTSLYNECHTLQGEINEKGTKLKEIASNLRTSLIDEINKLIGDERKEINFSKPVQIDIYEDYDTSSDVVNSEFIALDAEIIGVQWTEPNVEVFDESGYLVQPIPQITTDSLLNLYKHIVEELQIPND